MRKMIVLLLPLVLMVILSLACIGSTSKKTPEATAVIPLTSPNLQATIDAAVAATCEVRADILAGASLLSRSATETVAAMQQSIPTPTPTEAYEAMDEDKLAVLIMVRVQMATKATLLASDQSIQAVADGAVTAKEQEILYTAWYYADEMIAYADEVIVAYQNVYADLTVETMSPLKAIDSDLQSISQETQAILPVLEQIGQALDQGRGQSDKVVRQLETAAENVKAKAVDAQGQAKTWSAGLQTAAQQRVDQALAVKPKRVAKNQKAALQKAVNYIDAVQAALVDQKITQAELANIAQLGANAAASLTRKGGTQLVKQADTVNEITAQIAGGHIAAARTALESFQAALPAKP